MASLEGCGDLAQELWEKSKSFMELGYPHGPAAAAVSTYPERAAGQRHPAHSPPGDKQHPGVAEQTQQARLSKGLSSFLKFSLLWFISKMYCF